MIGSEMMNFSITCWPGRSAVSGAQEIRPGQWGLVMHLDPVNMVITGAPFPGAQIELARWCRELSREATRLAARLDPEGETGPRHAVDRAEPPQGGVM